MLKFNIKHFNILHHKPYVKTFSNVEGLADTELFTHICNLSIDEREPQDFFSPLFKNIILIFTYGL